MTSPIAQVIGYSLVLELDNTEMSYIVLQVDVYHSYFFLNQHLTNIGYHQNGMYLQNICSH